MLGDLGRAEDMVQEAWLRWSGRHEEVDSPRAYLVTLVTRLCLNELDSAKTRREESRADRLPEPVDLDEGGIGRVEMLDQVSMAFLVVLQRLTPAERAVLLLRDVFDFDYKEIAALVGKTEPACRKLLERARENVATEKRLFSASPEAHRRLLAAFTQAAFAGDLDALVAMLAEDAVMITDGGPEGRRVAGMRNLQARSRAPPGSPRSSPRRPAARTWRPKSTSSMASRRSSSTTRTRHSQRFCSPSPTTASTGSFSTRTSGACATSGREATGPDSTLSEWSVCLRRRFRYVQSMSMHATEAASSGPSFVRKASFDDVSAIARIWHIGWGDGHLGHVPPELVRYRNLEQFVSRARERIDITWVAELRGQPMGFVVVRDDEVEQLYVDRTARGTGVAATLLHKAEAEIRGAGHRQAWLAVVAGNQRARSFYARLGWRDSGPISYLAETEVGPLAVPSHRYEIDLTEPAPSDRA